MKRISLTTAFRQRGHDNARSAGRGSNPRCAAVGRKRKGVSHDRVRESGTCFGTRLVAVLGLALQVAEIKSMGGGAFSPLVVDDDK